LAETVTKLEHGQATLDSLVLKSVLQAMSARTIVTKRDGRVVLRKP